MTSIPFPQSYWVQPELLCAGQYPGDLNYAIRDEKLRGLLDHGLRRIVCLIEEHETARNGAPFASYLPRLEELAADRGAAIEWHRLGVRDASAPTPARMREILAVLNQGIPQKTPTYFHCWGGHGRTGTVAACYMIQQGMTPEQALAEVTRLRKSLPKNHDPFEGDQREFILGWKQRMQKETGH
jgi:hypothetical protein